MRRHRSVSVCSVRRVRSSHALANTCHACMDARRCMAALDSVAGGAIVVRMLLCAGVGRVIGRPSRTFRRPLHDYVPGHLLAHEQLRTPAKVADGGCTCSRRSGHVYSSRGAAAAAQRRHRWL